MSRSINTICYTALCRWAIACCLCYLAIVFCSIYQAKLIMFNSQLGKAWQNLPWKWLDQASAFLGSFINWLPFLLVMSLVLLYKERSRAFVYLKKTAWFVICVAVIILAGNQMIKYFSPGLCGRSADFTHQTIHKSCFFFSLPTTVVTGVAVLAMMTLTREHWPIKCMLIACSSLMVTSLLFQGIYYPLQMSLNLMIALITACIALFLDAVLMVPDKSDHLNHSKL